MLVYSIKAIHCHISIFLLFRAVDLGIGPNKFMRNLTKRYAAKFPESPEKVSEIIEYFSHESIKLTSG